MTSSRVRLADLQWIWKPARFQTASNVVRKYASHLLQLALDDIETNGEEAASEKHAFMLDIYKDLQDLILVRGQLMHIIISGRDTTACLMSCAFFLFVRHPKILSQVRDEIQTITGGSTTLIRAHINHMKCSRCGINESKSYRD